MSRTTGKAMIAYLVRKIRRSNDKKASATTDQLAKAADVDPKLAGMRLWWLENKDGLLVSKKKLETGGREWRLSASGFKKFVTEQGITVAAAAVAKEA